MNFDFDVVWPDRGDRNLLEDQAGAGGFLNQSLHHFHELFLPFSHPAIV